MAAVDFLSQQENVDAGRIGIIGICGWGGIALNAAAADTRIKATVASTMYDMTRVSGNGYFDSDDKEESRHAAREALAKQRVADPQAMAGGVVDPLPEDAPQFVKDYHDYYKTERGYHARSGNSNDGWRVVGTQAYANSRFLYYINEIRSAVMVMHGEPRATTSSGSPIRCPRTRNCSSSPGLRIATSTTAVLPSPRVKGSPRTLSPGMSWPNFSKIT